jgi:hypothetical protein
MHPFVERDRFVGFFFLDGDADALRRRRTLTLLTSFKLLVARKPRRIARVTGSMFGNCRALPP